jgi:DNA polymerase I-like protein with 3'-5' exonuclease and polymerase domains
MTTLVLDFETSIYNNGNAFDSRNFAVTYSFYRPDATYLKKWHGRYDDLDFKIFLKEAVSDSTLFVGCNAKFDLHWLRNLGITLPNKCRVWDVQLAEFVLSGQTNSFASLNSLAELYGLPTKLDAVSEYWEKGISTEDIPADVVEEYNNYDVELTYQVYLKQLEDSRMTPALKKLILLQGADLLVLQEMEYNGIKFDKEASVKEATVLKEELEQLKTELTKLLGNINFNSGDQLSVALFGGSYEVEDRHDEERVYKSGPRKGETYTRSVLDGVRVINYLGYFRPNPKNELAKTKGKPDNELVHGTRYYSTASDVLGQLPARTNVQKVVLAKLNRVAYIEKLVGTYLEAIPRLLETQNWGDYIHGQFNQVVARTGRLSSSKPNRQNTPPELDQYLISRFD